MLFSTLEQLTKRKTGDLIVFPFWERKQGGAKPAAVLSTFNALIQPALDSGDFSGKEGETLVVYTNNGKEKRCLLLGLGREDDLTVELLRRAYSNVAKESQRRAARHINVVLPTISELRHVSVEECLQGIAEGILLTNYRWEKLASIDEETVLLKQVCLIGVRSQYEAKLKEWEQIAEGVYLARDLINGNADIVTPAYLGLSAQKISEKFPTVKTTIFDLKRIEKEKMGLLLAVARGSSVDPAFIQLSYKGHAGSKDHTLLVGKGVTFDTGGLNLKPTGSMETMRDDMSGAAAVLATIAVVAALNLKVNVTAIIPATENAIDGKSFKPGDVYKSLAGITVEVGNTDAEGRLILADALTYGIKHHKPTRMIDVATLTGAMVVALGDHVSGLFCNNDQLASSLLSSSEKTNEPLWRMPLYAPYKELLKSDIADIKNIGGRAAGAITAALFLQEFVQNIPWAHLDIAGPSFSTKEKHYLPKNGIGFGVRLLVDFFQNLNKKN